MSARGQRSAASLARAQARISAFKNTELITSLRRAIEALAPFVAHRLTCDASPGDRKPCTCGLNERLAAAQRLCIPNSPPANYQPRRYG
jgi:hypothetical protein